MLFGLLLKKFYIRFSPYESVEKIIPIQQINVVQFLVQFQGYGAIAARNSLQGHNIYDGCCQLDNQTLDNTKVSDSVDMKLEICLKDLDDLKVFDKMDVKEKEIKDDENIGVNLDSLNTEYEINLKNGEVTMEDESMKINGGLGSSVALEHSTQQSSLPSVVEAMMIEGFDDLFKVLPELLKDKVLVNFDEPNQDLFGQSRSTTRNDMRNSNQKRQFRLQAESSSTTYKTSDQTSRLMASATIDTRTNFSTQSLSTDNTVVSVDWLHVNLKEPNLKVLDALWYMPNEKRNPIQKYQVAHISDSLFFYVDGILDRTTKLPNMLPYVDVFADVASALGIQNKDGLVVFDGKGIFSAACVWWMFRVFRHEKVGVLDGGLQRWRASGYNVESSASSDAILKASAVSEAIEKVYQGQIVGSLTFQTKYQSHIVWNLDQMLDASQTLLQSDELKKRFNEEGISLECPIVTSCSTNVATCILALGLHRLRKTDVVSKDEIRGQAPMEAMTRDDARKGQIQVEKLTKLEKCNGKFQDEFISDNPEHIFEDKEEEQANFVKEVETFDKEKNLEFKHMASCKLWRHLSRLRKLRLTLSGFRFLSRGERERLTTGLGFA